MALPGAGCKNSDAAPYARNLKNYPGVLKLMNFSLEIKNQANEAVALKEKQVAIAAER